MLLLATTLVGFPNPPGEAASARRWAAGHPLLARLAQEDALSRSSRRRVGYGRLLASSALEPRAAHRRRARGGGDTARPRSGPPAREACAAAQALRHRRSSISLNGSAIICTSWPAPVITARFAPRALVSSSHTASNAGWCPPETRLTGHAARPPRRACGSRPRLPRDAEGAKQCQRCCTQLGCRGA